MRYSYYKIGKLEENRTLKGINRSTYENLSYKGEENDFLSAEAYVPDGVICLMSAARYYGLLDFLLDAVDVAVARKKKVSTLSEWLEIGIYYFDPRRMDFDVQKIRDRKNSFHIFDIEKTVVDIIYYRNKVGMEETSEILKKYLGRKKIGSLTDSMSMQKTPLRNDDQNISGGIGIMNADSVKARLKKFAMETGHTFQEALVYYDLLLNVGRQGR